MFNLQIQKIFLEIESGSGPGFLYAGLIIILAFLGMAIFCLLLRPLVISKVQNRSFKEVVIEWLKGHVYIPGIKKIIVFIPPELAEFKKIRFSKTDLN